MDEEKAIDRFDEQYAFLSNFYPCDILYRDVTFPALENAYQAAKYAGEDWTEVFGQFAQMTPGKAKRKGGKLALREDWDKIKLEVMEELLRIKFSQVDLKRLLLITGELELMEGNHWHDNFWGSCSCEKCGNKGLNHLGKLLMKLRSEYKNSENV